MLDEFAGLAYAAGWSTTRFLPEFLAYRSFSLLADQSWFAQGKSITQYEKNLDRIRPGLSKVEMRELSRKGMRSYMRYWCDTFRFPDWSQQRISQTVTVENEHLLMDAIAAKTGVIVSLPHAGNWDHAGAYFCGKGVNLVTVAEHLKPEKLFQKFLAFRQNMGMEVLPLDGRVLGTLAQRLRQGALVALVADRDLSRSGIDVKFFGGPARMPAGPALLALKTDAPLITAFVSYTETGINIVFKNVVIPTAGTQEQKVAEIVQMTAQHFEDGIKEKPEDWHMLQRIWIDGDFVERN